MSANGLYGKCPSCDHIWRVAKLPMPLHEAAELAKRAACPNCGVAEHIKVASEKDVAKLRGGEA